MRYIACNKNNHYRAGDYISESEQVVGFVGVDADGQVVTDTLEMYDDAKNQSSYVVDVMAVVREID